MIINKEIKRLITSAKFFQNGKATIEDIEKIINEVNEAVDSLLPPPREFDKCMYCNYKEECKLDE